MKELGRDTEKEREQRVWGVQEGGKEGGGGRGGERERERELIREGTAQCKLGKETLVVNLFKTCGCDPPYCSCERVRGD
jgi:hypothetical protein